MAHRLRLFGVFGFAVSVCLGEGIGLGFLILLIVLLAWRGTHLTYPGHVALLPAFGVAGWLVCGVIAWFLGGYGMVDAGEIGRWFSLTAFLVVPLSLVDLDTKTLDRIALCFFAALALATAFALVTVAINVRPGEWLVRGGSAGVHQGRMPYDSSRTVAGGFYFHRLMYAHVVAIGAVGLLVRQIAVTLKPWRRIIEAVVLAAFCLGLLLTYARAAVFGVLGAGLILGLMSRSRVRFWLAAAGITATAAALAIPTVQARIVSGLVAQASVERSFIWAQAVRIIADHPLGVGLGNYTRVVGEYYDIADATFPTRTYGHSLWLTTWSETGPLGMVCLVGGLVALALVGIRRRGNALGLAALGVVICLLTIGLTHDVFYHPPVAMSYAAVLGFLATRIARQDDPAEAEPIR